MDGIDFKILKMLWENGREPYYKIAREVGLTGNAVRKRIQSMIEEGVIEKFDIILNLPFLGYDVIVAVLQHKSGKAKDAAFGIFAKNENVVYIADTVENKSAVVLLSRGEAGHMKCVESLLEKVKSTKLLSAFIYKQKAPMPMRMTDIDWGIIMSLKGKPRKSPQEVARELYVSSKTVRRHLEEMIKKGVIHFGILVQPTKVKNVITYYVLLEFKEGSGASGISKVSAQFGNTWFVHEILSPPGAIMQLYRSTLKEVDDDMRSLREMDEVKSAILFIPSKLHAFSGPVSKKISENLRKTMQIS
ncbi:MAG: winged helix-turn-helix transcriptional regulator [Candidatus Thermoplasmatota archaeon]|nr:winged helix-turn-helix transcriptional regulator [Candidatus Thermoplasmatota archaeon]